jgi:hypothetical protein
LYVVASNVFLSTSLFDRVVNHDRMALDVHYDHGWSLWPSTIHAKHVSIRSSDSNVMWLLKLDDVTFDVALLDLPRRRFTVESAHGRGISMRLQTKRKTYPDHQDEIRNLPPIDGFPAFAVRPAGPPHPEVWDDDQYHLIDVHLDRVHADDVREVWIDDYRFSGHANLQGRFHLKPIRELDVGPVHGDVLAGEVEQGFGRTLVHDLAGKFDVTVASFDPRDAPGHEPLRYVDVATDIHARSVEIAKMPHAISKDLYLDGVVDGHIGARIVKGVIADGTTFDATVEHPRAAHGRFMASGELSLHAEVTGGRLVANANFGSWRIVRADGEELIRAPRAYASLDSAGLDLAETPFEDLHVATGVESAIIDDARIANCLAGSGTLGARAEIWPFEKRIAGSGRLKYRAFHDVRGDVEAGGSGEVLASVASFHWDTGVTEAVEIHSQFHDAWVMAKPIPVRRFQLGEGVVVFRSERLDIDRPLDAPYAGHAEIARIATAEGVSAKRGAVAVRSRRGTLEVEAEVDGGRVTNGAAFSFLPFRLASENGQFRGRGRMKSHANRVEGQLRLQSERVGIQTKKATIVGNSDIALDIRQFVSKKSLTLGPSKIELRNARGTIAGKPAFTADYVQLDGTAKDFDLDAPTLTGIDAHLRLANLATPDVRLLAPLWTPKSELRVTGGAFDVSGEVALSGEETASGDLTIDAKHAGMIVGSSTVTGDLHLAAKVTGASESIVHLDGSRLAIRNLEVHRSSFEAAHWHGDVTLDDTIIDWASGTPAFATDLTLTARDARPVLGMLNAPKIWRGFVSMPNVALRAHLDADPDGFLLSDIYARGGDVAFRGSYAVVDGKKRAAFVLSKGPLAIGIRLGKDGAHPRFFGLERWLREEEKKVKAAPIAPGKP